MTQTEQIRHHLTERGSITSLEAVKLYGITRLAARIYDLKAHGLEVEGRMIDVQNRHGQTVQVKEYYLPDQQMHLPL